MAHHDTPRATDHAHGGEGHHIVGLGTYVLIWLGLLALTGLTVALAGIHLGRWVIVTALAIASIKSALIPQLNACRMKGGSFMSLRATLTPGMYHGLNKKPPFFEGWYYKLVSADERYKVAIIPGVILGQDAHSFVQVLEGVDGSTTYHSFPYEDFQADDRRFALEIGENRFDDSHLELALERPEGHLTGHIQLGPLNPWPVTLLSPGVMGWYAWVPRMECYHGVLSFDHSLQGTLTLNGKIMDFSGGHGYIEKDWGQAFPAAWIWFQSNHFGGVTACITASVAIIPWVGRAFRGFIVGLWLGGELHRFTTYNGSRIETLQIFDDHVDWVMVNRQFRLPLTACRAQGGLLRGPTRLDMGKRVLETLSATVRVRLLTLQGELVFEGVGAHTGLEVIGDLPRLLRG